MARRNAGLRAAAAMAGAARAGARAQAVLVEGATGALGGRIARCFLQAGWRVGAGGRNPRRLAALHALGAEHPDAFEPAVIVNAAGIGGGTFDRQVLKAANVDVLEPLIARARASGALLVQLSTPATQFRFEDRLGIREEEPFSPPVSPYAESKQAAERLIRAAPGLRWMILRLRAGYGLRAPSMVEDLRAMALRGPVPLVDGGRAVIDLVHADDIAEAVLAVARRHEAMAGLTANIAGPQALAFRHIVETLARCEGREPRFVAVPAFAIRSAATVFEAVWAVARPGAAPPLTRHVAGALIHSQTLDLGVMRTAAGWSPRRRFDEFACEQAGDQ